MKRNLFYLIILLLAFSRYAVQPALAQSETPPVGSVGEVRVTVINSNTGKVVTESLEVMLHIMNLDYVDTDMLHGKSQADGTFVFANVPFDANKHFAVMATFNGVTYFSDPAPADMSSLQVAIDVPVYESTKDLTAVQIDQMHVLFNLSPDGLETKELYVISNTGQRTVKDVYDLGDNKSATLKLPLPKDADYVFFKPDDQDRFIKLDGEFADTYPILPGNRPSQIMTSYLVPYSGERTYRFTAPVNVAQINLLLPDQTNISLKGTGLTGPKSLTLQDGTTYQVYSSSDLKAGQSVSLTITGTASTLAATKKTNNWLAMVAAFLGFGIIGAGIWWWRKSESAPDEEDEASEQSQAPVLDDLIAKIAQLDETYEQQSLSSEEYQSRRHELMQQAKQLL